MSDEKFEGFEKPIDTDKTDDKVITNDDRVDDIVNDDDLNRLPTPPNKITVHINDDKTPIILLFGAQQSGKTMTLVRLGNYLRELGYSVQPDRNFCTTAWEYKVNSLNFNKMLGTTKPLKGTDRNDFLFITILDKAGNPVCQLLEAAGEDYFSMSNSDPECGFPNYMQTVFNTPNKKVWLFITEPDWDVDVSVKKNYVARIRFCREQSTEKGDKFVVLYNKVDRARLTYNGKINAKAAEKNVMTNTRVYLVFLQMKEL